MCLVSRSNKYFKMKYIKKYKVFESEKKRFDQWLDNPKKSTKIFFKFPTKKTFNLKDKRYEQDDLYNFIYKKSGVDIYDIISNEIDLGFETQDESPIISKDEVMANFDHYFDEWIKQEYNNDYSKFYRMYDLDFEEYKINIDDFNNIKDIFNNYKFEYPYSEYGHNFEIKSIQITNIENNNIISGEIDISRLINDDEKESIKDFLIDELSNGVGSEIEQDETEEIIDNLIFYTSIKTYWSTSYPEWYFDII